MGVSFLEMGDKETLVSSESFIHPAPSIANASTPFHLLVTVPFFLLRPSWVPSLPVRIKMTSNDLYLLYRLLGTYVISSHSLHSLVEILIAVMYLSDQRLSRTMSSFGLKNLFIDMLCVVMSVGQGTARKAMSGSSW